MKIPFVLPSELGIEKKFLQEVVESKGGFVGIPDQIFTKNLLIASDKMDDFVKEWRSKFDFHLAEFQMDVNPNPKYNPESINIQCSLNPFEPALQRPTARYVFPSTEFVDANWKISGKFGVSASLGFNKLPDFLDEKSKFGIDGEAKIEFSYAPKVARIDSGTSGSQFHWNFRSAEGKGPQGGLDLKIVIMRPRTTNRITASFEVAVRFDRKNVPIFGDDIARAAWQSIIQFNPGPI